VTFIENVIKQKILQQMTKVLVPYIWE